MIRPLKCLMISVVGIWIAATLSAQVPGWRYERLGLPPATGDVRVLNGVYHSAIYGRTSLFDPDMNVWNDADIQLGTLQYWTLHGSGVGIMQHAISRERPCDLDAQRPVLSVRARRLDRLRFQLQVRQ